MKDSSRERSGVITRAAANFLWVMIGANVSVLLMALTSGERISAGISAGAILACTFVLRRSEIKQ